MFFFSLSVENILFLRPEQEKDKTHFLDKDVSILFCLLYQEVSLDSVSSYITVTQMYTVHLFAYSCIIHWGHN